MIAPLTGHALRRVYWCLGVTPFDAQAFVEPQTVDGLEIRQVSFEMAARQQRLCTP